MVIKHWMGYGTVCAKKLCEYKISNSQMKLVIEVSGSHECGISTYDKYFIYSWLLNKNARFSSQCSSEYNIDTINIYERHEQNTDFAIYEIVYDIK